MIKNNKQLTLTKKRIQEFNEVINELQSSAPKYSPLLMKAQIDALIYQKNELLKEVEQYELLLTGDLAVLDVNSLSDLPKALIMSRISMGLTQKDLAERLGFKEQQIQRYENTEYASASFSTLLSVVNALDLKITEDIFLPKVSRQKNLLLSKLNDAGLDKSFVEKRIAPRNLMPWDYGLWVDKTVERLNIIFGWTKDLLLSDSTLVIGRDASMVARFKMPAGASVQHTSAYTQYAFSIANIVANNCVLEKKEIPQDSKYVREFILSTYEALTFESVLSYTKYLGIPVISLNDSGAFHGATWRIKGRNVIVLKQKSKYPSKWIFDLLHELYHAGQSPELEEFSVVELSETSEERRTAEEEILANNFATKVLLGENAEVYIEECFKNAKGRITWLKNSVIQVSEKYNLDCGVLAYQVAKTLQVMEKFGDKDVNWWGTANNLQVKTCDPSMISFEVLTSHMPLYNLKQNDRDILEQIYAD